MLLLFIISAFRDPYLGGTDAIIYQDFFERVPKIFELLGYDSKYAVGYTVLNSAIKQFCSEYIVYQIIYILRTLILLDSILKQYELSYKEKCLFLFSYFCFRFTWNTWVLLRQNITNLLFWLLLIRFYKRIDSRKREEQGAWRKETIILLIATILLPTAFHTSGVANVFLLALFWCLMKLSVKTKMLLVPIGCIGIYMIGDYIYPLMYRFVINFIDSRYAYFGDTIHSSSNLFETIFRLFFFLIYAWHFEKEKYMYKDLVINAQAIIVLLGSMNVGTFDRMLEYYAIGLYIGMALFLNNFKGKSKIVGLALFGVVMVAILCRFLLIMDAGQFLNYSLWFL